MYCVNCGKKIDKKAVVCPLCGVATDKEANQMHGEMPVDNGGFLWGVLGFFIPLVGLILYLIWKDTKPKTAKSVGIGAIVSIVIGILFYIFGMAII